MLLLVAACTCSAPVASAGVQRFAVIVGNNHGHGGDAPLRYAEADAAKVYAVLRELGGVEPANMVLLQGESAFTIRRTLITFNDRIRAATNLPNAETSLFVYYSGHADAEALRLGRDRLEIAELAELVRGSAATFRLLLLDACRSGTLTRLKGGRRVAPFALPAQRALRGEGLAFLTAASASEDAQESDELRGSFFTHAFVSGLRGAADADRDGAVVLEEAYKYAFEATLRMSSRTFAGVQHPTFRYDYRGQGSVVLTRIAAGRAHATLTCPRGIGLLVFRGSVDGAVIAELSAADSVRTLSLPAGAYFVRGRARDVLLEGQVKLAARDHHVVDVGTLRRVEYARLVRKGEGHRPAAHALELGAAARSVLPNAETACLGATLGYRLELEQLGFWARLGACTSSSESAFLDTTTNEYDVTLAALHTWDLPWVSLGLGMGGGAAIFDQRFDTSGRAPDRRAVSPLLFLTGSATVDIARGYFVGADVRTETHFLNVRETTQSDPERRAAFAARVAAVAGRQF
jgi:hypothetical protein